MSISPCGDQTQLCSECLGTLTYFPFSIVWSHSTREKLIRHWSPSFGGFANLGESNSLNPDQGQKISTVHPLSVSFGLLSVPSTCTAVFKPIISQALTA